MASRQITHTEKDEDGDITALCNPDKFWSPRLKWTAINEIESGEHRYWVDVDGKRVDIHVAGSGADKYLCTDPDETPVNNLDYLPNC